MISLEQQHKLTDRILFREPSPAAPDDISRYFGPPRFPGTTSIGYRQTHPDIFQDTLDSKLELYDEWLERSVTRTSCAFIEAEAGDRNSSAENTSVEQMIEQVAEILTFKTASGISLADAIPQQVYEDTFVRILSYIRHPAGSGHEPHMYFNFNALCHRIGLALLNVLETDDAASHIDDDIARLIHVSVLSGHVGINLKSSASAASLLLNRDLLPLPEQWIETPATVAHISSLDLCSAARHVLEITSQPEGQFGLESLNDYYNEVVDTNVPTLLVFFCDDYLESLIDMKRFEVLLKRNPNLQVLFIPRAGRYGNDLAHADLKTIIQEPVFKDLQKLQHTRRFQVSAHGPRAGCIDPRDVSATLIHEMDRLGQGRCVIFETKGCRNFEMLCGRLTIPWYASFNCNRALSIRTVGVDGPPVFLRIPPGLKAYDGFTRPKIGPSPSYPRTGVRFAHMTTRDLYTALETSFYQDARQQISDEFLLNTILMNQLAQQQSTVAELIQKLNHQHYGEGKSLRPNVEGVLENLNRATIMDASG